MPEPPRGDIRPRAHGVESSPWRRPAHCTCVNGRIPPQLDRARSGWGSSSAVRRTVSFHLAGGFQHGLRLRGGQRRLLNERRQWPPSPTGLRMRGTAGHIRLRPNAGTPARGHPIGFEAPMEGASSGYSVNGPRRPGSFRMRADPGRKMEQDRRIDDLGRTSEPIRGGHRLALLPVTRIVRPGVRSRGFRSKSGARTFSKIPPWG